MIIFFRLLLVSNLLSVTLGTFCVHGMIEQQSVEEFAESIMTTDKNGHYRAMLIGFLGEAVPAEKWSEFKRVTESMMTENMNREAYENIFKAFSHVLEDKRDWTYAQIQRLMENTRIQFTEHQHAVSLIRTINSFENNERAQAFVSGVLGYVEADGILVDGNRLMTHMQTMKTRMQGITSQDLRELLRSRQSTHMKEVHESIAESLKRLQVRYPTPLSYPGNICDMVSGILVSLFPEDPECVAKAARTLFETYKGFILKHRLTIYFRSILIRKQMIMIRIQTLTSVPVNS